MGMRAGSACSLMCAGRLAMVAFVGFIAQVCAYLYLVNTYISVGNLNISHSLKAQADN